MHGRRARTSVLARFGRAVAEQVLDAVEGRLAASRVPGIEASVAGQRVGAGASADELDRRDAEARAEALTSWLTSDGERGVESREVTERDIVAGSSLALTGGTEQSGSGSLWGGGAVSRFDGHEGELTLSGEVASGMLGVHVSGERATVGVLLAHSRGAVASTLTGLYPYGRYAPNPHLSVWGVVGYAAGTLRLDPEGASPIETDMNLVMGAVGVRGLLVRAPEGRGVELAVKSDALGVRTTAAAASGLAAAVGDVMRLRIGLEGTWRGLRAAGGRLSPSLEIGVRHDGGDAEAGFGAEVGARVAWSDPEWGVAAEVRGRGLLTHEDGGCPATLHHTVVNDGTVTSERTVAVKMKHVLTAFYTMGTPHEVTVPVIDAG